MNMTEGVSKGERIYALLARLTPTERRCLELVDQGLQSKEIARVIDRAPNSVDTWLRSASRKLEVRDRFQAAKLLAEATRSSENRDFPSLSILRYQDSHISPADLSDDRGASAGEGNGLGDLGKDSLYRPESHDSGSGKSWTEPSHPAAKFFGGRNRFTLGQRVLVIVGIAIALSIAFGIVMDSYMSLSRLLSSS
ncbi:MAG: LuxR family transcriptional regulator [Rhizobiaceae bacterium]|nr:MAG: LuxR family transcriptional regulator [Rhizobiaceae bacterium]